MIEKVKVKLNVYAKIVYGLSSYFIIIIIIVKETAQGQKQSIKKPVICRA